jgi:hypothetical protein
MHPANLLTDTVDDIPRWRRALSRRLILIRITRQEIESTSDRLGRHRWLSGTPSRGWPVPPVDHSPRAAQPYPPSVPVPQLSSHLSPVRRTVVFEAFGTEVIDRRHEWSMPLRLRTPCRNEGVANDQPLSASGELWSHYPLEGLSFFGRQAPASHVG